MEESTLELLNAVKSKISGQKKDEFNKLITLFNLKDEQVVKILELGGFKNANTSQVKRLKSRKYPDSVNDDTIKMLWDGMFLHRKNMIDKGIPIVSEEAFIDL